MECSIREFDQVIIRGLRSADPEVHSQCVHRVFYEDLAPLLHRIRCSLFKGSVSYDELVSDFYLHLSRNGWKVLDSFQGRNGARLSTWLSHVAWHHFMNVRSKIVGKEMYFDDLTLLDRQVSTVSTDEMRVDIERTLSRMTNERYVAVIRLLIIDGVKTEDVARIMGTTVQNIYNLKHRAIAQFLGLYEA